MHKSIKKTVLTTFATVATLGTTIAIANADNIVVKSGDTLSAIAARNNTSVSQLIKANNLKNPNLIFVGQRLSTTSSVATTQTPAQPTTPVNVTTQNFVIVKAGDTLSAIARRSQTSVANLIQLNSLSNPNLLYVGQKIVTVATPNQQSVTEGTASNNTKANNNTVVVTPTPATNSVATNAAKAADFARNFIGTRYVWGGATTNGFDCSGLVSYVMAKYGINLPHQSGMQAAVTDRIPTSQAQKGDLLFWTTPNGTVFHVAISLGNGSFISALDYQYGVQINHMGKPANFAGRIK